MLVKLQLNHQKNLLNELLRSALFMLFEHGFLQNNLSKSMLHKIEII